MEVIYKAFDGKEFDTEWECEQYECMRELASKHFCSHLYAANGEEIQLTNVTADNCDNILFMDIKSQEDYNTIDQIMDCYGCGMPPTFGRYYYDIVADVWKSYDYLKAFYDKMNNFFEKEE